VDSTKDLQRRVIIAARDYGISTVLFRNATGRKLGLNIADTECFSLLQLKGISTPTELARYTGLTTGSATAMLDRLEKAELITRKPNPKDRRGVLIEINRQNTGAVGPMVASAQKSLHELVESYSDRELEIIADFLTRFTTNVTEYTSSLERDFS